MRRSPVISRSFFLLPLTLSLLTPPVAFAQTLFGPKSYTLTTSSPQTVSSLVSTTSGPAHLHVVNGAPDGSARLRDVRITLNGLEVVSSRDVGPDVALVDTPVFLLSSNILTITLTGPLNGTLTLTLERRAAALTSVTPNSGHQGETLTVTVVGSNTHFVQGTTQLFAGPGISVGGAPPGTFGPVTVTDLTHLTATLTIQPTTVLGPRTLLAKTNGEKAALFNGFTVLTGTPAISGTTVTTLAGSGTPGLTDGSGSTAQFRLPADVAPRADGSAVVADTGNSKLRAITPDGTTSTVPLPVTLLLPAGVTVDASGRTVIADTGKCVIRIVNNGTVTTIGSGTCGFADGAASTAKFKFPRDVVADAAGNLYVADTGNFRVRKIDPQGNVTTLAGSGAFGSTDGPATTATFGLLAGIAVADGTVLVSDAVFHKIRQIDPAGNVTTLAGTGTAGFADGAAATAQFAFPTGLTRDGTGNLYIADTLNSLIRRLTPQGSVETVAGTGARGSQDGPGTQATFSLPVGLGLAPASPSKVFVADTVSHKIRAIQVVPPPTVTALRPTFGVQGDTPLSLEITGTNLTGATAVTFLPNGTPDPASAITATVISVEADGTKLTATVTVPLTAPLGPRVVTVTTPGGTSSTTPSAANTFTIRGLIRLIPTFQTLTQGGSGGLNLTVEITTPAPSGGLLVTLTSTNTAVATVPPPVTIPAGATSILTSVSAVGEGSSTLSASATGYATATAAVTVILPPPTLTSFTPSSGAVGTAVTITGGPFSVVNPLTNTASFTGSTTRILVPVTTLSQTQLRTTVPQGAVTGPLQVRTPFGSALSTGHFVVLPTPDFSLTATPASAAAPGGTATYRVSAAGTDGFTGLVNLSLTGLPVGVTALFSPPTLTAGQSGTLTLQVGSGAPTGAATLTLTGTATINSTPRTRTATVTLELFAPGTTTLSSQILSTLDATPLEGVTLRLGTQQVRTDSSGRFLFRDPPTGDQILFIDGSTVTNPPGTYHTLPIKVTITAGAANTLPYTPHLVPIDTSVFSRLDPTTSSVIQDPRLPGFQLTIPQGVTLVSDLDGSPITQVAVTPVPPDRLPVPPPPPSVHVDPKTVYLLYFFTPGGAIPSTPITGFTLPNDIGAKPGDRVTFFFYDSSPTLDPTSHQFKAAGRGTISADGSVGIPDPGVGFPKFCCAAIFMCNFVPQVGDPAPPGNPKEGEPVDVATGQFILEKTDLVLPGRLPILIQRGYFSNKVVFPGPFGPGTSFNFEKEVQPFGNAFGYIQGNGRSDLLSPQPDGTFQNLQFPFLQGAVLTVAPDRARTIRFKDGSLERYNASGRLIEMRDRNGNAITIQRDSAGNIQTITEAGGRQLTVRYNLGGRISAIADPLDRIVSYIYNAAGLLETVTNPAREVTRYTYDSAGRLLTITDPRGILFLTNVYDSHGHVVQQTQADGGIWRFAYTTFGSTITEAHVTNPRGSSVTYRFNAGKYPSEKRDALGQATQFVRGLQTNLLLSTTDPLGRVTRFTYDAVGNVTSITDPQGNVRTFTYEPTFNKVTSITDPLGNVTTFEYDTVGNLIAITDPEQNLRPVAERRKTRITYNAFGQPISTTDPLGNVTTFEYDAVGNLTKIMDPLGNTTTRSYDAVSRLVTQTDPRGLTTQFAYDPVNRITQITDPRGGVTRFSYDGNGNLLTVTDARGNTTRQTYDTMDRLNTRTDPLGRVERYQYDPVGNLVSFTDRKGQVSTFTYDALNRRTRSTFGDGSFTEFVYDAAGRLVTATDSLTGTITEGYDILNRLLRETTPQGSIQYAYDAVGRRTTMTVNGQAPVAYAYDAASRLRTIAQSPLAPVDIQYDATGRRTLLRLPNGVTTAYDYDLASRLTRLTYTNPTTLLGDLQYTYDAAGNRLGVGGSFARTLLPDPVPAATYDAANQQLSFGNRTMTYDQNGNLASLMEPTGSTTFAWDARNRLAALSGPSLIASFQYDALGRRILKSINGQAAQYQYDNLDVIREFVGQVELNYQRTLNIDEVLTRGTTEFYLTDDLGSTLALADTAATTATTYTYDPFGRTATSGILSSNSLQFSGRENDGTGVYFYRARYYHPGLARFISEDPIGFLGGDLNVYIYVSNNPTTFFDPLGLTLFFGRAPIRPLPSQRFNPAAPRPQPTPPPQPRPANEPPPGIGDLLKPTQPTPWWVKVLRLLDQLEKYFDLLKNLPAPLPGRKSDEAPPSPFEEWLKECAQTQVCA